MAFEGWNDAGDAATTAAQHIAERAAATKFAQIDSELFYDFQNTRPFVRIRDGVREIDWPTNEFSYATISGKDLIILNGTEPQLRWRTYSQQVQQIAQRFGAEMVVSLGALIADVVHTRPATIFGSAYDPKLCERLDLEPSSYEGPTGIVGVVHDICHRSGLDSISLWGAVPSYVPHAPSPKVALALVDRVSQLLEIQVPSASLELGKAAYERQISRLVDDDEEMTRYVEDLEERYDEAMNSGSGDDLIAELENFLKEQD